MDKKQIILDGGTNEEINAELKEFFGWKDNEEDSTIKSIKNKKDTK